MKNNEAERNMVPAPDVENMRVKEVTLMMREEGMDAISALVQIPKGSLWRKDGGEWEVSEKDSCLWLGTSGEMVEVVNAVTRYIARDYGEI